MKQIYIKDLKDYLDEEVQLKGWVYNFRSSGKISFLQFRDGTGFVQCIVSEPAVDADVWQVAESMTIESSVILEGKVSKHPKKEEYEIQGNRLKGSG